MNDISRLPEMPATMPSFENKREKGLYEVFYVSVLLKGINAALETVLGLLLMFTDVVNDVIETLVRNELLDDPNDFLATHIQPYVNINPKTQLFAALYLLSHGLVKGVLVVGLLRNKLWAYPASLVVFTLFILYQVVRWFSTHSIFLVGLTLFDLVVMWLIWHEWQRARRARGI